MRHASCPTCNAGRTPELHSERLLARGHGELPQIIRRGPLLALALQLPGRDPFAEHTGHLLGLEPELGADLLRPQTLAARRADGRDHLVEHGVDLVGAPSCEASGLPGPRGGRASRTAGAAARSAGRMSLEPQPDTTIGRAARRREAEHLLVALVGQVLDPAEQLAIVDLNIRAVVEITLCFLPSIRAARGKILNVASVAAYFPGGPGMAAYYATRRNPSFSRSRWPSRRN